MPDARAEVLIYARQSLGKQESIDQQEEIGRDRAEQENWPVHAVLSDPNSASRYSTTVRKNWERLLADLDRPEVGILWLWESSRGDRELETWAAMLTRCRKHGVKIFIETHERLYDLAKSRDRKTLAEDGVASEYESSLISERVTRAMAKNAKNGKPHGRTPYGYRREYAIDEDGKRVIVGQFPHPEQAKVVRRIFADIERRVSLRSIAADLNARQVPTVTGAQWTPQRVRDVALMATYAGKRVHNPGAKTGNVRRHGLGTLTPGTWPALVSLEQYYAVRRLLTDPQRRTSRPGRAKHLLSMIATCGVCGGVLAVRYSRDAGEYTCRAGGHVRGRQEELDEYVRSLIGARLADPDDYNRLVNQTDDHRLQAARDTVAEIETHYEEMIKDLRARVMSSHAFSAAEPGVLADLEQAKAVVADLEAPESLRALLGDPRQDFDVRWQSFTPVARRLIVRSLFASITLHRAPSPGHRGPVRDRVRFGWSTPQHEQ